MQECKKNKAVRRRLISLPARRPPWANAGRRGVGSNLNNGGGGVEGCCVSGRVACSMSIVLHGDGAGAVRMTTADLSFHREAMGKEHGLV